MWSAEGYILQRGDAKGAGAGGKSAFFCPAPPAQMNFHRRTETELRSEHSCRNWVTCQSQVVLNVQFISKAHYYMIGGLDVCCEIKRWRITYKLEPNRCTAAKWWARCQRQLDVAWLYGGRILMSEYCEGWVCCLCYNVVLFFSTAVSR